jgi:hypothetical protein
MKPITFPSDMRPGWGKPKRVFNIYNPVISIRYMDMLRLNHTSFHITNNILTQLHRYGMSNISKVRPPQLY